MEQKLESVVKTESERVNRASIEEAVRLHPIYGLKPQAEQEEVIELAIKNPLIAESLIVEKPSITNNDVLTGLEEFEKETSDFWRSYEAKLDPERPSDFLEESELKQLAKQQFIDTYLGWLLGKDHAATYLEGMKGTIRERNKNLILREADRTSTAAAKIVEQFNVLNKESIERIFDYKARLRLERSKIEVSQQRTVTLTADIKTLNEQINEYDASQSGLQELLDQREEKTQLLQSYRFEEADATAAILNIKGLSAFEMKNQHMYATKKTELENLALEAKIAENEVKRMVEGPGAAFDPRTIGDLFRSYVNVAKFVKKMREGADPMDFPVPKTPFVSTPEPEEYAIHPESKIKPYEIQSKRTEEALDYAKNAEVLLQPLL